jgi:hypothetical protein
MFKFEFGKTSTWSHKPIHFRSIFLKKYMERVLLLKNIYLYSGKLLFLFEERETQKKDTHFALKQTIQN